MAGTGPAPKEKRARDRDNKVTTELVYNGETWGDPLPDGVLGEEKDGSTVQWHPQTLAWWESLRQWPLMEDEPAVSWMFMLDTALMHHAMWSNGRWDFAAEVRLRLAKYGIMPDDRRRLGMRFSTAMPAMPDAEQEAQAKAENVTSISKGSKRRQRILDQQSG